MTRMIALALLVGVIATAAMGCPRTLSVKTFAPAAAEQVAK